MGCIFVSLQNSCVEALVSIVMGIRKWGLWEVIMSGWSPHDEISSLTRRETRELASFLTLPSEDTTRKTVLTRS